MFQEQQRYHYATQLGDYAHAARRNLAHAKKTDVALNITNILIMGCGDSDLPPLGKHKYCAE